jgi:hypothetical protein
MATPRDPECRSARGAQRDARGDEIEEASSAKRHSIAKRRECLAAQKVLTPLLSCALSANMTVGLLAPVFQQMDPMKIGDDFRSTRVAEEYAQRLDGHARNLIHDDDIDATEALARGYPSHGFVIDRTEARSLFHRVSSLDGALADVVAGLGDAIMPSPSPRQVPIIHYLNKEATDEQRNCGRRPTWRKATDEKKTW